MLVIFCWQVEWSVSAITTMFLFSDPIIYLLGATSHTFYRLAGQLFKWPYCQPFHVVRTSRLPTCQIQKMTLAIAQKSPQLWLSGGQRHKLNYGRELLLVLGRYTFSKERKLFWNCWMWQPFLFTLSKHISRVRLIVN